MSIRRSVVAALGLVLLLGTCTSTGLVAAAADDERTPHVQVVAAHTTDVADAAAARVAAMDTAAQAASVVMGHIPTTDPARLADYMSAGFGGFILMGSNVPEHPEALREVTAALRRGDVPPLIAVDQEGGVVSRLPRDVRPAARALRDLPADDAASAFAARGALVAQAGATVNFGIVADVTADASSFIFSRVLATTPDAAAERTAAAVAGEEPFAASTIKHFPGHGAAAGDSHHSIPTTPKSLAEWQASDARPFIAGIDAGASLLMFGHLAYPAVDADPASLSARWHEIARDELGFDGVMITDDLGMLASSGVAAYRDPVAVAVQSLVAGNDMALMIAGSTARTAQDMADGIAAAVVDGTLPAERLSDAAERVMALRLERADTAGWVRCDACEAAG